MTEKLYEVTVERMAVHSRVLRIKADSEEDAETQASAMIDAEGDPFQEVPFAHSVTRAMRVKELKLSGINALKGFNNKQTAQKVDPLDEEMDEIPF